MRRKIFCFSFFFIVFFLGFYCIGSGASVSFEPEPDTMNEFVRSFLSGYELSSSSIFTHEYHELLLKKTEASLSELEDRLSSEGFGLCGRVVIMGYEEDAVPTYYPNFKKPRLDDETASFMESGLWSKRQHNKIGFMTGFLLSGVDLAREIFLENCGDSCLSSSSKNFKIHHVM